MHIFPPITFHQISILHPQFVNFITNSGGLGSAIVEPVVNAGLCVNRDRLNEWIDEPEQYLTGELRTCENDEIVLGFRSALCCD